MFARMAPTGYGKRGSRPGFPWNRGRPAAAQCERGGCRWRFAPPIA